MEFRAKTLNLGGKPVQILKNSQVQNIPVSQKPTLKRKFEDVNNTTESLKPQRILNPDKMEFDKDKIQEKSQTISLNIADSEINQKFCVAWMRASYMLGTVSHKMSIITIFSYKHFDF